MRHLGGGFRFVGEELGQALGAVACSGGDMEVKRMEGVTLPGGVRELSTVSNG